MRLPRLRLRTVPRNTTTPPNSSSRTSASASSTESGASLTAIGARVRASPPETGGIRASSSPSASGSSTPTYSRLRAITTCRPSAMRGCAAVIRAMASRTVAPGGSSKSKWPRPAASLYEANKRTSTCTLRAYRRCENRTFMDTNALVAFGVTLLLVLANGFFVAAEYAFVRIRKTQLDELAQTSARARLSASIVDKLDQYISASQLGVTLCSLAIGWIGEPAVAVLLHPVFGW